MALFCRVRQTKLNHLCSLFKRSYLQVSVPRLSDYAAKHELSGSMGHRLSHDLLSWPKVFGNVRSFAAPVQVKKKVEEKSSKPRMNEQIKSHMIRLVTDGGHDIVSLDVALQRAKSLNLDLVEVDRNSNPIVCKIMDYNKERYNQHLKEKERAKSKADTTVRKGGCKEVRFTPKIEQKDLQTKAEMAKRLMGQGYRVKCMVLGSEAEDLKGAIDRLCPLIEDVALVEEGPRVERSQAYVIVRHIKFGLPKKGLKSAAKSVEAATSGPEKGTASQPNAPGSSGPEKYHDMTLSRQPDGNSDQTNENPPENRYIRQGAAGGSTRSERQPGSYSPQMPQKPSFTAPNANSPDNRYIRQPGSSPQMPQSPKFAGPAENSSENRYSRQPGSSPQMPQSPKFTGPAEYSSENRYSRQPGSSPPIPQSPKFTGPAENRYSRQPGPYPPQMPSTRSPPGTEQQRGGNPSSYRPPPLPPKREIPKQHPSSSDFSTPKSYGVFSNPNSRSP